MTQAAAIDPATAKAIAPVRPTPGSAVPQDLPDPLAELSGLRRPRLLIRAARFGLCDYERGRDLRRVLGRVPGPGPALLDELLAIEAALEATRTSGDAAWRPARHVETLVAVMAEARLSRAMAVDQENASGISAFRRAT